MAYTLDSFKQAHEEEVRKQQYEVAYKKMCEQQAAYQDYHRGFYGQDLTTASSKAVFLTNSTSSTPTPKEEDQPAYMNKKLLLLIGV